MKDLFAIVGGSVIGKEHKSKGRNNQDSYWITAGEKSLIGIGCDGCSSSLDSEVGAKLLSRYIAEHLRIWLDVACIKKHKKIINLIEELTIEYIKKTTEVFTDSREALDRMMLATIMGIVMTKEWTTVFSCGDGVFSVNGVVQIIDQQNYPLYLSYKVNPKNYLIDEKKISFTALREIPTKDINSILIATDGVVDLIAKRDSTIKVLGKLEKVGDLKQFEQDSRYIKNSSLLQKRLNLLNAERIEIDWANQEVKRHKGVLSDDTTIILAKRR